ncbi:hypothetical protein EV03_0941 [Prochlorococcus marinus str. PAC1]|uniref:Uncharacterized protein n=1 Tax=Prochlorococcus marinus str. PAC1 TaxID=59924 RepID=A0A0A2C660_PROMR|nr:hypothetical protein EV03_0941 [Prochlorococcus marinus str. PAC1]
MAVTINYRTFRITQDRKMKFSFNIRLFILKQLLSKPS